MGQLTRNIILSGAGAVIDWRGPKTYLITEEFIKSGFLAIDGKTITYHIAKILSDSGKTVNFELILSVIEELIIFYSGIKLHKNNNAFLNLFFKENNVLNSFLNFKIKGNEHSLFSLEIPNDEASSSKLAQSDKNPTQFFFELLLINLHTIIGAIVDKYNIH